MMVSSRKLRFIVLFFALALVLMMVGNVAAVTDGELDGDGHPFVGLMVFDINGNPAWRCSGTLLTPTVMLTAGHCTDGATGGRVWFESDVQNTVVGYPFATATSIEFAEIHTHPDYLPGAFFFRDVGIAILSQPVFTSDYGQLPTLNQLDAMATRRGQQDVTFTAVGYGLQESFPDAASWQESALRIRMVAYPKLNQINVPGFTGDFSLLLSNNAHTGGTCFGDSGGPNFVDGTNVVGGVTSFGINGNCAGTGGVFRMDRSWSLDWVSSFLN